MRPFILFIFLVSCAAPAARPNSREVEQEEARRVVAEPEAAAPASTEPDAPVSEEPAAPPPSQPAPELLATSLTLTPSGRHLLTTSEPLALHVEARGDDGSKRDVTNLATFTVRNPAIGTVTSGRFIPASAGATVITATFDGVSSNPLVVTTVAPHWASQSMSIQLSGAANAVKIVEVPLPNVSLTNVERMRFAFRFSSPLLASVRVAFKTNVWHDVPDEALLENNQASLSFSGAALPGSQKATALRLTITLGEAGTSTLSLDLMELVAQFLIGVNLAWLDGAYSHDFGKDYHHPSWSVAYDPGHVEAVLAMLDQLGVRLLRVWVFESCEGLLKDANEHTTGLDSTFVQNFDDFMFTRVPKYDVRVELMLLGAYHTVECSSPSPITSAPAQQAFFANAMVPFVQRYASSPWLFGYDLANEPEGAVGGATGNYQSGATWEQMRSYLSAATTAVRNVAPNVYVSAGSGWHGADNIAAGRFSGLGFTHLDFHQYSDTGALPTYASLQRHARILIGEAGQASHTRNTTLQNTALVAMLQKAYAGDYWGFMPWAIEAPGVSNEYTLIDPSSTYQSLQPTPALLSLSQFAKSKNNIGP